MCGLRRSKQSEKYFIDYMTKTKMLSNDSETYVGDGLILRMETNEKNIEINGDGCRLTFVENRGRIRVNGDGCRLRIDRNIGDVEYRGDGGRVSLGPESTATKVHYFGDGGFVNIAKNSRNRCLPNPTDFDESPTKKNYSKNVDDTVGKTATEKRSGIILRNVSSSLNKTVRIVGENTKISSGMRTKNSTEIAKICRVAS